MFTKEQLVEKINNPSMLKADDISNILKSWRIDPIYEDDNSNEYYDEMAIHKLKHALKLKEQGRNDAEISSIVNNGIINPITAPTPKSINVTDKQDKQQLNNITVDVTSQTLSLLAESIAQKITLDVTDKIRNSDIFEPVMDSAKIRRDNEILSKQIAQLLAENKKLISRNNMIQKENSKFKHFVGNLYIKQQ